MSPYPDPPQTVSLDDLPEPERTPEGVPIPAFTPWQPVRARGNGWSAAVQRGFIAELTRIGSVGAAARAVGKTARSAYQLRDKAGAESFAAAWEAALLSGQEYGQQVAIDRALHGEIMPTFRRGQFAGYKMIHNDRLLIAALNSSRTTRDAFARPALDDWHRRLEKWEAALRREAMDLADGAAVAQTEQNDAWEDHVVWRREMKLEKRRQRNVEIRAAVRKGMAKTVSPAPGVRII
jgi:hypothetical protein